MAGKWTHSSCTLKGKVGQKLMLQKSWEQLRQKLFVMESSVQVHERCKVLDLFKEIPGCKKTGEVGVVPADCEWDQKGLGPRNCFPINATFCWRLIKLMKSNDTEQHISDSEGVKQLEVALQYEEQNRDTTATDVIIIWDADLKLRHRPDLYRNVNKNWLILCNQPVNEVFYIPVNNSLY